MKALLFPRSAAVAVCVTVALVAAACGGTNPELEAIANPSPTPTAADPTAVDEPQVVMAATPTPEPTATPEPTETPTPDATTTPEPTATATSTSEPTPTPTPPPTATPVPQPTCSAAVVGPAANLTSVAVEFDGDGATDVLSVYSVGAPSNPDQWRIRVETAAGDTFDNQLLVDSGGVAAARVIGGADVDGDAATDELFTVIGTGAAATIVAIHNRAGCNLVQVGIGGAPTDFPVGGSVGSVGGITCVDTDANGVNNLLVAWTGLARFDDAEGTYLIDGVEYRLVGTDLQQVGVRSFVANIDEADFVYAGLSCGAVSL